MLRKLKRPKLKEVNRLFFNVSATILRFFFLDTTTTSKGGRRIRPVSRELESLYIDEGAANILREMEGKPHSKRRATMTVKGACYASSIDLSLSPSPRRRHEKPKQDSDSDKRKRKAKVQPIVGQSQSHQDNALQFWEAVPVIS